PDAPGRGNENRRFDHDLMSETAATRAKRDAHGRLASASCRPREQKTGDVQRGNQDQRSNCSKDEQEPSSQRPDDLLLEGDSRHTEPARDGVPVSKACPQTLNDSIELGLSVSKLNVRQKSAVDVEKLVPARRLRRARGGQRKGRPELTQCLLAVSPPPRK